MLKQTHIIKTKLKKSCIRIQGAVKMMICSVCAVNISDSRDFFGECNTQGKPLFDKHFHKITK